MKSLIRNFTTIAVLSGLHLIGWCIYFAKVFAPLTEWRDGLALLLGGVLIGALLLGLLMIWSFLALWSYLSEWSEARDYVMKSLSTISVYGLLLLMYINSMYLSFVAMSMIGTLLVITFDYKHLFAGHFCFGNKQVQTENR